MKTFREVQAEWRQSLLEECDPEQTDDPRWLDIHAERSAEGTFALHNAHMESNGFCPGCTACEDDEEQDRLRMTGLQEIIDDHRRWDTQCLQHVWDQIGPDALQAHAHNPSPVEDPDNMAAEAVRDMVGDCITPNNCGDEKWYEMWSAAEPEYRRAMLRLAFPDGTTYGY